MKISHTSLAITIATIVATAAFIASDRGAFGGSLDTLASSKVSNFPKSWRPWPLQRDKAESVYRVEEEGGTRFIKAYDDHDASAQIFYKFSWPVGDKPMLSWRWRATTLPEGARESDDNANDSACAVYVIIGQYQGHAIKYVWSSSLAPGTSLTRHGGKLKIRVLDSGAGKKGSWVKHAVDVPADYEALFGQKLDKDPSGIAILTDGNAVHKPAGCDYADFAIEGK